MGERGVGHNRVYILHVHVISIYNSSRLVYSYSYSYVVVTMVTVRYLVMVTIVTGVSLVVTMVTVR